MWTCPKCGEQLEDQFDSCWKCAGLAEVAAVPPRRTSRWRVALGLGAVFELGMVALLAALPRESWFFAHVLNFLEYSHFPFLWFLSSGGPESMIGAILCLLLVGVTMSLVWGALFFWGGHLLGQGLGRLGASRRQKCVLGWSAGVLGVAGLVFAAVDAADDKPTPFVPTSAAKEIVAGNTALAVDVYKKLGEKPGNVFFSPYGISVGLGLVYAGARGETQGELGRCGHFGLPPAQFHQAFGGLIDRVERLHHGRRLTLLTTTGLWAKQGDPFSSAFLDVARRSYHAEVETADFQHAPAQLSSRINGWIEGRTRGRITAVVADGQFDAYTRLLLCNALYFKGNWRSQFRTAETRPASFHVATNRAVSVPMMVQKAELKMTRLQEPRASLLALPYYGGDLEMVIVLPDEVDGLVGLEAELTAENLNSWLGRLDTAGPNETWVRLPRFTTRQDIDLVPMLRSLGVVLALGHRADFSGMDGTTNLFLSAALQRTFVEVNERGTEAAVATLFEARTLSQADSFNADHPFLFLIRDRGSGSLLFLGRLAEPGTY